MVAGHVLHLKWTGRFDGFGEFGMFGYDWDDLSLIDFC